MTYHSRTILFLIIALVFFIITPVVALYAQGWRYDFEKKRWVEVGGLLVKSLPKEAEIFIGEKKQKKTTPAFFKSLKPGNYSLTLRRDNFLDWSKTLAVEPRIVTEATKILLFPENAEEEIIEQDAVKIFYLSPNANEVAAVIESVSGDAIKIKPLTAKSSVEEIIFSGGQNESVSDFIWGPFGKNIIFKISQPKEMLWINYDRRSKKIEVLNETIEETIADRNATIEMVFPHIRKTNFIVLKNNNLFNVNINQKTSQLIFKDALSPKLVETDIIFFDKKSFAPWRYSLVTENLTRIVDDTLPPYSDVRAIFWKNSTLAVLGGNDDLFVNFPDPRKMTLLASEVKDAVISSDGSQLAYSTPVSIRLLWLKNQTSQPFKKQGEEEILFNSPYRNLSKIIFAGKYEWHIIFSVDKNIRIMETDNRGNANNYLLAAGLEFYLVDGGKSLLLQKSSGELVLLRNVFQ